MDGAEPANALARGERATLPVRRVTVNSIVALNLAYYRKAAGLTQEELGERIGWGKTIVSTAERSWDAKRVRSFSADDLMRIAMALRIPLVALFLPPEDDGTAVRYALDLHGVEDGRLADLLPYVLPASDGVGPAMDAYRRRIITMRAGGRAVPRDAPVVPLWAPWAPQQFEETIRRARDEWTARLAAEEASGALQEADRLVSDARARAKALQDELQQQYREAVESLEREREELERRVAALRDFERDYRSRLNAYLIGQLRELWAEDMRPEVDEMIDQAKRLAGESAGAASVVVFRQDGTYDIIEQREAPGQAGQGDEP